MMMARLTRIHQIEISSTCNLRCKYCPYPKMEREKTFMELRTYKKALEWVRYFAKFGKQDELALTGMGEAILHPDFGMYVSMARAVIPDKDITLSTNGLSFDENIAEICKQYNVKVYISAHRPEKAGLAIEIAKKFGVMEEVNGSPMLSAFDWAGQVDWYVSAEKRECEYISKGWGVVLTDGRISTCCLDAEGLQIIGNVFNDKPEEVINEGGILCKDCHMYAP